MNILELTLQRGKATQNSTPGKLTGIGTKTYQTLEDVPREKKIHGETRIPAGRYRLSLHNWGKATKYNEKYKDINHRGMIALEDVPGYSGVLVHTGNTKLDTLGCLLIGLAASIDAIGRSQEAYRQFYPVVAEAIESGEVWITIKDPT